MASDAPAPPTSRPVGVPPLAPWQRVCCVLIAAACAAMLGLGAWMTPSRDGYGTHTQLGMPPCAWKWTTGTPCATCGMTTAVSHAAHAELWASLKTQPFGFLVALGAAVAFWIALHGAITGARVDRVLDWLLRPRYLVVGGILFFGSWGYKVWADAHAIA